MVYNIVVWLYDNIDYDSFSDKNSLEAAALSLDRFGAIKKWMNHSADWLHDVYKPDKGEHPHTKQWTTLRQGIDEWNEKDIMSRIEGAKSQEDLDRISLDEIESTSIKESLQSLIDEKAKEFKAPEGPPPPDVERFLRDIEDRLRRATTQEEIDALPSLSSIKREYGADAARTVSGLVSQRGRDIETLSERAFRNVRTEMNEIATRDGLDSILGRLDDIPNLTSDFRDELRKLINEKKESITE